MEPEPGWYPDPDSSAQLRWWDGRSWTDRTRELHATPVAVDVGAAPSMTAALEAGPTANPPDAATATAHAGVVTQTQPTPPTTPAEVVARKPRRTVVIGAVVMVIVVAAGVGTYLIRGMDRDQQPVAGADENAAAPSTAEDTAEGAAPEPLPSAPSDEVLPAENEPDPTDPAYYLTADGSEPLLGPDCLGLVSLCLGNAIERGVERFGSEDERFGTEQGTYHLWKLGDVDLLAVSDAIGSIRELTVYVSGEARVWGPDGILIGGATVGEFLRAHPDASAEATHVDGTTFVHVLAPGDEPDMVEFREVSFLLHWQDEDGDRLLDVIDGPELLDRIEMEILTGYRIGYASTLDAGGSSGEVDASSLEEPLVGVAPDTVLDVLAEVRDGYGLADDSWWDDRATLNVVTGTRLGGASGRGMHAFFFVDGRYIGTDTWDESNSVHIAWSDDTSVGIEYVLYREDDPGCCPTGGTAIVEYVWDGGTLSPLDAIPPAYGQGWPHR